MRNLIGLISIIGVLFAVGAAPTRAATVDPHTPVSSDGRVFSSAELAVGPTNGVNGFEGLAAEGQADSSLASIPASVDTEEQYAALLRKGPKTAPVGVETILGFDSRSRFYTATYPHRAIGLIDSDQGTCTGWLINSNTVATAGHCVNSGGLSGGVWSTNVVFYPGRDGPSSPNGSCSATTLFSVMGWVDSGLETHDYGAIKLDCTIGNTVGWFGFWSQIASLNGQHALISGYPGDKPLEQWGSFGKITATGLRQLFYFNDTFGGMSGSSIYQPDRRGAFCQGTCAMAIHAYGIHGAGNHATQNHGTRIVKAVFNNFLAWRAAP